MTRIHFRLRGQVHTWDAQPGPVIEASEDKLKSYCTGALKVIQGEYLKHEVLNDDSVEDLV